jgi:hypothetical protein
MKIRRRVTTASPIAKARIIHSRCNATLPARTWTKPLTRATRNRTPKTLMYPLSIQPAMGITNPMNTPVAPITRPIETKTLPAQRW